MALTIEQANAYLAASFGVELPTFLVDAALETVVAREALMLQAGYTPKAITLMQAMAVALIAGAGARRIQSQGAPSGASRSFFNDAKGLATLQNALEALDTAGILTDLIGTAGGSFFRVVG